MMKKIAVLTLSAFAVLLSGNIASAVVNIDWVTIGDPGNDDDYDLYIGAVSTTYRISKYEVTNAQYVEFLNAKDAAGTNLLGLYENFEAARCGINFTPGAANGSKYSAKSGRGNNPVTFVSAFDSLRFANWLHNGQGAGDTESGAYTLTGNTRTPTNQTTIARSAGARVFLPTDDEWYKAAYYKGGPGRAGYWNYATQRDTPPMSDQPPGAVVANSANFFNDYDAHGNGVNDGYAVTGSPDFDINQNYLTDVGAYTGSISAYGTFDQTGNVYEWNESYFNGYYNIRGGSWYYPYLGATDQFGRDIDPTYELSWTGFRVAGVALPLPGDYDGNTVVNEKDYLVWRSHYGSTMNLAADGNHDGTVDAADYVIWRDNLGTDGSSNLANVPEPATLFLALGFMMGVCGWQRGRDV